jgi:hypothetical protein
MTRSQLGFLCTYTLLSMFFMWGTFHTPDPEGSAIDAFIGVSGTCIVAPFWFLYRGRVPFLLVVLLVVVWVLCSLQVRAVSCRMAGIWAVHWWDHLNSLWLSIPGLIVVVMKAVLECRAKKNLS